MAAISISVLATHLRLETPRLQGAEVPAAHARVQGRGERPAPGRAKLLAKKRLHSRRRRLSAELQNVRETSEKLGEAPTLSNFLEKSKMLHFGKIPKKIG